MSSFLPPPPKGTAPPLDPLLDPLMDGEAGPSTRAVHAGVDRPSAQHAVPTPIVASATFAFADSAELVAHFTGAHPDPAREEYGRYGNPTVRALEKRLAALEDPTGEADALAFISGASTCC